MDSKLRNTVIAISLFFGLSVLAIVGYGNYSKLQKMMGQKAPSSSVAETPVASAPEKNGLFIGNDSGAWKRDESFFDSEDDSITSLLFKEMSKLKLEAESIEEDVYISILDYSGEPKTGEKFKVNVKAKDSKTLTILDEDKDGHIYVNMLNPGECSIELEPVDGYECEAPVILVNVKEHVEYSVIQRAIEKAVELSEDEAKRDNLMQISAKDSASRNQSKTVGTEALVKYGIDISSDNGEVDFNEVYDSGVRFVMLRAGYRGAASGKLIVDSAFKENAKKALRAGLEVGAYFFSQAITEREAVEEASVLCDQLKGVLVSMPVAVRIDKASGLGRADAIDSKVRTDNAIAFLETVKSEGYEPMVYASAAWFDTNLEVERLEKYNIWMADFSDGPNEKPYYYDVWQYTASGKVDGVNGEVSLNLSYMQ